MALDVYLVVFHYFDVRALKRLEIPYATVITTLTFVPALVFLFIRTPARGPVYGSAIVSPRREHELDVDMSQPKTDCGRFGVL